MASELIGSEAIFGVELALQSLLPSSPVLAEVEYAPPEGTEGVSSRSNHPPRVRPYGGVRFWVRGQSFGDLEDHTFFWTVTGVRGALRRARRQEKLDLSKLDDASAFEELYRRVDQLDFTFYNGEGFDRFHIYVWGEAGQARFVWREREWTGDYPGRPTHGGRVPFDECERVLGEFETRVEALSGKL
jgi:hypothetical protein